MLKHRIIPCLLLKEFGLIKGKQFDHSRRVGSLLPAIKIYNQREVDELLILDVAATLISRPPDFATLAAVMPHCLMPLTIGGGITNLEHIKQLLKIGADKVIINSAAYNNPGLILEAANNFGSQCIVVGVDVRRNEHGEYVMYSHCGRQKVDIPFLTWIKKCEELGAGEILLTDIDHDGEMQGYNTDLIRRVSTSISIPIIAAGGAGKKEHAYEAIQAGASAISAASLFHFTEITPLAIKSYLFDQGIAVRQLPLL